MIAHLIRGACPGLSKSMQTGDGLLVRLQPKDTISVDAFIALCTLARRHGNGIMEVTARGNVQLRGLSPQSTPELVAAVTELDVAETCSVPVISDPLPDDPSALIELGPLVATLRGAIGAMRLKLAPKVSIVIDDGGRLHLDAIPADIRLRALPTVQGSRLHVALGGDARSAASLGVIALNDAVEVVIRLLSVIAKCGSTARAASILATDGIAAFRSAAEPRVDPVPGMPPRPSVEPIGQHRLRGDAIVLGVAPAFGQADADTLEQLLRVAGSHGARTVRPAPGRALLLSTFDEDRIAGVLVAAKQFNFIVNANDPRRRIAACPGKPACLSGWIPARVVAATVARELSSNSGDIDIHISGCAKGCAHPASARVTIVGGARGYGIIREGSARAKSLRHIEQENLVAEITRALKLSERSDA